MITKCYSLHIWKDRNSAFLYVILDFLILSRVIQFFIKNHILEILCNKEL